MGVAYDLLGTYRPGVMMFAGLMLASQIGGDLHGVTGTLGVIGRMPSQVPGLLWRAALDLHVNGRRSAIVKRGRHHAARVEADIEITKPFRVFPERVP